MVVILSTPAPTSPGVGVRYPLMARSSGRPMYLAPDIGRGYSAQTPANLFKHHNEA